MFIINKKYLFLDELEINYGQNTAIFWDSLPQIKSILEHYSELVDYIRFIKIYTFRVMFKCVLQFVW